MISAEAKQRLVERLVAEFSFEVVAKNSQDDESAWILKQVAIHWIRELITRVVEEELEPH
jgi:hypothetical protein